MIREPEFTKEQWEYFIQQQSARISVARAETEAIRMKIARTLFGSDYHYAASANAIRLSKLVAELAAKCAELENIQLY